MEVRRGEFELWATAGFGASFLTKKVCGGFFFLQMLCYGPVPFRNRCRVRGIPLFCATDNHLRRSGHAAFVPETANGASLTDPT